MQCNEPGFFGYCLYVMLYMCDTYAYTYTYKIDKYEP
jgi:hypothetical protein